MSKLNGEFPKYLLEKILEEFPNESTANYIKELAQKHSVESLDDMLKFLCNCQAYWMSWSKAGKLLREGNIDKVLEATKRAERIDLLRQQVSQYLLNSL